MNTNPVSETIRLPARLDLASAGMLLADLQTMAASNILAVLDASQVETLSYPTVQVMLAWARTQPGAIVVQPSSAFSTALSDLGLDGQIAMSYLPADDMQEAVAPPPAVHAIFAAAVSAPAPAVADVPVEMPASEAISPSAKRILTIDDSKTMRDMLRLTLVRSGFDVLQAVDGCDGLDVLAREEVDIIITDINMPRMDGYGVIENVRKNTKYDATPILVLTTENDREKKDRARDLGATGFIVKPFDPSKLVDVIYKVSP